MPVMNCFVVLFHNICDFEARFCGILKTVQTKCKTMMLQLVCLKQTGTGRNQI